MKIGILKTDAVRPEWVPTFGEYPDMFERVLKLVDPDLEFEVWDIEEGEFPTTLDGIDGFIITGSKSSVYDDKPWIRSLEALVRELYEARKKVIGICFGHQLIAQALGGLVDKSPKGWGVGVHSYTVSDTSLTDDGEGEIVHLLASHQDQVMTAPAGAEVIARNEHCEIAGLKIGEQILTFQGHPEFIPEYSREIMTFRRPMIGDERVQAGMASLGTIEHQGERVARWILDFLRA